MSNAPTVVILGGTGRLGTSIWHHRMRRGSNKVGCTPGHPVSEVFLTDFRTAFPNVKIPTRDTSAQKAQDLEKKGAQVVQWDPTDERSLVQTFNGAGVVIDILNSVVPTEKKEITKHAIGSGAKVYFLSEFGVYAQPVLLAKSVRMR